MRIFLTIFLLHGLVGCKTDQVARTLPTSTVSPVFLNKSSPKSVPNSPATQSLFVEKKDYKIEKKEDMSNGSLFTPRGSSAFLFSKNFPLSVGDFVNLKVLLAAESTSKDAKTETSPSDGKAQASGDSLTQELVALLPNLGSPEGGGGVLSDIEAEVIGRSPEGDLTVRSSRTSQVEGRSKEISFEALIPSRLVNDKVAFTTKDLRNVKFNEDGAETIRRSNTSWLNEYSMRFSGFSETASKNARQLADDKRRLGEAKNRLDNRIQTFGSERKRMADERAKIYAEAAKKEEKLAEAEKNLADRTSEVNLLKSQLEEEQKKRADMEAQNLADQKAKDEANSSSDALKDAKENEGKGAKSQTPSGKDSSNVVKK
jgi:hypothetical protein